MSSVTAPNPFEINRHVLRAGVLSPGAKCLLLSILDFTGHGKSHCWASNDTIAGEIGSDERQVRRLAKTLEAGGWITVERTSESKFSNRRIFMGPSCIPSSAPGQKYPGAAPSAPGQIEPCTRTLSTVHPDKSGHAPGQKYPPNVSLTSPRTTPETSVSQSDDDDVSRKGGEDPGTLMATLLKVASYCTKLPVAILDAAEDKGIGARIKGDWRALSLALLKLDRMRRKGKLPKIDDPGSYLAGMVSRHRDGESFDDELDTLLDDIVSGELERREAAHLKAQSRQADEKKRLADEAKRLAREKHVSKVTDPMQIRFGLDKGWAELARAGTPPAEIERKLLDFMNETDEEYELSNEQRGQRRAVAGEVFAEMGVTSRNGL